MVKRLLIARPLWVAIFLITTQLTMALAKQPVSYQQKDQLRTLQNYLNGIRTLQANFSQNNPDGTMFYGIVYLKRLGSGSFGKLRLEYKPPATIKIIVNGEKLRHQDKETGESEDYPIGYTPASFLLRHKIDFFNDLDVKKLEEKNNQIYLMVTRSGDDDMSFTLVFDTVPLLRLQGWTVIDAQSNKTDVRLSQVEIGISLDDDLFSF